MSSEESVLEFMANWGEMLNLLGCGVGKKEMELRTVCNPDARYRDQSGEVSKGRLEEK